MTKSTKSHIRERSPLLYISSRVHELVARAMRGKCVRHRSNVKVGGFIAPHNLILPRVRTYHTKKPSRFVHALPARPLKVQGGRGANMCADGIRAFCQPSPVGEGGARSVTDEESFKKNKNSFPLSRFSLTKSAAKVIKESVPLSLKTLPVASRRPVRTKCHDRPAIA